MYALPFSVLVAPLVSLAFAGTLIATVGLITDEELGLDLFFRNGQRGWMALPLLLLVGPMLLLRSLGARDGEPPVAPPFAIMGYLIVIGWSMACGHLLLRLIGWASAMFELVL